MARVVNSRALDSKLASFAREGINVTTALLKGAVRTQTAMVESINEGGGTGKSHTPSEPGDAPNTNTGRLVGSIASGSPGHNAAEVTVSAEYGLPLEDGAVFENGRVLAPRPFARPAYKKTIPYVLDQVRKEERAELRRRARG